MRLDLPKYSERHSATDLAMRALPQGITTFSLLESELIMSWSQRSLRLRPLYTTYLCFRCQSLLIRTACLSLMGWFSSYSAGMLEANRSVSSIVRSYKYASIAMTLSLNRTSALKFVKLAISLSLRPLLSYSYIDSDSSSTSRPHLVPVIFTRLRDSICTTKY
jgi:hypothetical protein